MIRIRLISILGAVALVSAAAPVRGDEHDAVKNKKIDRALSESLRGGGTRHVIVTVKRGYQNEIRKSLRAHGDVVSSEARLVNALVAEIHSEDVAELARHPGVEFVSADALVHAGWSSADDAPGKGRKRSGELATGVRRILGIPRASREAAGYDGSGVGVALIDSGIAPNADFHPRISAFYDFTRGGIAVPPHDDYGHGTHVAGLIGSSGILSNYALAGIAPNVHFVGLKVLDRNGQGRTSAVIKALEFVTANRATLGVHIVNLSLGHPIYAPAKLDPLVRAVEAASDAGLIVVVSAGNGGRSSPEDDPGYTGITSPGNAPSAITVGAAIARGSAARSDDDVAPYSSRGPTWFDAVAKPDLIAPGHQLVSDAALASELYSALRDRQKKIGRERFLELSGTSMAAGVTSGVVALMLDANRRRHPFGPGLSPNIVKALLQYTATPLPDADLLTQGAGIVNAAGAVELAGDVDTAAPAGSRWAPFGATCTIFDSAEGCLDWSRSVIWSDDVLTGTMVYYNLAAWSGAAQWSGDNIVWGTAADVAAENIVWGTATVWAANLAWTDRVLGLMDGDNIVWGTANDNIVWGTAAGDNIVWGTYDGDNIVWGTLDGDNIVWGTSTEHGENIVWGTLDYGTAFWRTDGDSIAWGTRDKIVWGTDDNIVWGTAVSTVPAGR